MAAHEEVFLFLGNIFFMLTIINEFVEFTHFERIKFPCGKQARKQGKAKANKIISWIHC